ncbi:murein L,D-transpeptidase [Rufibacter sediminis]|uniref:L,D-transpeptidase family protein n=1 Tax=Rufibacter sediminis TaxID=2762756 RepID=A0ABR6VSL9_9BACT|nr:L,D-transpeptidase family protein [Rufibacter sediminis]MBC3540198.1 L,D-transpeptidase family protein [Rufibacter sediminis]
MKLNKQNHPFILLFLLTLVLISACAKSGDKQNKKEALAAARDFPQQTDSVYVVTFTKSDPEFKKHLDLMKLFYRERQYRFAWFKDGDLVPQAYKFVEVLSKAHEEGLDPKDYARKDLQAMFQKLEQTKSDSARYKLQEELDVTLTASYFNYASDFYRGTVDPRSLDNIEWEVKKNKIKLHKALQTILKERESRYPYYEFEALHPNYIRLRDALKQYRQIKQQGGWPKIELASAKKLKPGDSSEVVLTIRHRLLGKPAENLPQNRIYDQGLAAVVKNFQIRHGLKPDGVVGGETLRVMNVPIEQRIDQIIINMERWRWVPKRFEDKYVFVNIPEYMLHVYEKDKEVLNMKVVVGKEMHATPVFSDKLEYIVFYPYWNITPQILEEEIAPAQAADPNYLARNDMELVKDIGNNKVEVVSPSSVDWYSVDKNFKYRVRQRPGKRNPLGFVKFIFPNEHNVYLHDTPSDHLFNQTERGFSHGCIRIEKPFEMAQYLLKDQKQWTPSTINAAMHGGEEKYVNLSAKVPVYIVYFTAWVDNAGAVHFREDIYNHDRDLEMAYFR